MDKKDIEAIFPLSDQQKGMFLESLLTPGSGIHISQSVWKFQGDLNVALFKQAWQFTMKRHAMLRTAFVWKGRADPLQVTLHSAEMPFVQHDLRTLPPAEQKAQVAAYLRSDRHKDFELSRAPLMRLALFQIDETTHQIGWTRHHILTDGWSNPLILQDVISFYQRLVAGQEIQLEPARSYREYVAWLKQQDMLQAEKFWRDSLQGLTQPTLPGRLTEAADVSDTEEHHHVERLQLSAADTLALTALSQKLHVTFNTLLQGMWALLLSRYSGNDDVIFGTTVSGRSPGLTGSETIVGLFINTLPLRVRVQADGLLTSWLNDIQLWNLDLRSYEYCSEGQVHQWSDIPISLPLFESILVFENYPFKADALSNEGFMEDTQSDEHAGAQTKYALTLLVSPGAALEFHLVWDNRRFQRADVVQILEHVSLLLRSFLTKAESPLSDLLATIPAAQIPAIRAVAANKTSALSTSFEAPRTPTEKMLAGVFAKVLNVEQIGRDENFLGSGGSSLAALQLIHRVRETFQVDIPLQTSFEAPTLAEFARRIEEAQAAANGDVPSPIRQLSRDENLPLSWAQQAIWDLLHPSPQDSPVSAAPGFLKGLFGGRKANEARENLRVEVYPVTASVRLVGKLQLDALTESFKRLRERHEILHTRFVIKDGKVSQNIWSDASEIDIPIIDLVGNTELAAQNLVQQEKQHAFNMDGERLWRVCLGRMTEQSHVLVLTLHPLIADTASARLLVHDLAELYRGILSNKPATLAELSIQFADYAAWQRDSVTHDRLQQQLDFWRQHLGDYRPLFPIKRARNSDRRHVVSPVFTLSPTHIASLRTLSDEQNVPWALTLAATFQILLCRCTNEEDIAMAISMSNRSHQTVKNVAGPFGNYLPLRTLFTGEPNFFDVLQQVATAAKASLTNQDIPFETVAKNLSPNLIQVMFAVEDQASLAFPPADAAFSNLSVTGGETNFELCMFLRQSDAEFSGQITYSPDCFDEATIDRFAKDYQVLLETLLTTPNHSVK